MELVKIIDFVVLRKADLYYFAGKYFKTEELFIDYFFNDFLPKTKVYYKHREDYDRLFDDFNL